MEEHRRDAGFDKWWAISAGTALVGVILVVVLWNHPTSKLAWLLALFFVLFALALQFNPRFRFWRRASWCYGIAGVSALVPTLVLKVNIQNVGAVDFISDSSPFVVLAFLATGCFLTWIDARQVSNAPNPPVTTIDRSQIDVSASPGAISNLVAGHTLIVQQGVSEETLQLVLNNQGDVVRALLNRSDSESSSVADFDLVWRLIDDLKMANRHMERTRAQDLISQVGTLFQKSGNQWPVKLKRETLLLLAEEERAKIDQAKDNGSPFDTTTLKCLLQELGDVGL